MQSFDGSVNRFLYFDLQTNRSQFHPQDLKLNSVAETANSHHLIFKKSSPKHLISIVDNRSCLRPYEDPLMLPRGGVGYFACEDNFYYVFSLSAK